MNQTISMISLDHKIEIENKLDENVILLLIFLPFYSFDFIFFNISTPAFEGGLFLTLFDYLAGSFLFTLFLFSIPIIGFTTLLNKYLVLQYALVHNLEYDYKLLIKEIKFLKLSIRKESSFLTDFEKKLLIFNDNGILTFEIFRKHYPKRMKIVTIKFMDFYNSISFQSKDIDFWINEFSEFFIVFDEIKKKEGTFIEDMDLFESINTNERMLKSIKTFKLLREKQEILSYLRKQKMIIEEDGIVTDVYLGFIKAERSDLKVYIGKKENRKSKLEIIFDSILSFTNSFKLEREVNQFTKSDIYSKMNYITDFNLSSLNTDQVINFIESKNIYYELSRLCKNSERILFSGKRLSITVEQNEDPILLLNNLKLLFSILAILEKSSISECAFKLESFTANYHCLQCQKPVDIKGETCHNCGAPLPRCIICWKDPEYFERIVLLECCGFYAHENHLEDWLQRHDVCPICQTDHPDKVLVSID